MFHSARRAARGISPLRRGRPTLTEALWGEPPLRRGPQNLRGELDLLGDLAAAAEATATGVKTKVTFMGIARFSR